MSKARNHAQLIDEGMRRLKKSHPALSQSVMEELSQDAWLYVLERKERRCIFSSQLRKYLDDRVHFYLSSTLSIEGNSWGYAIDSLCPYKVVEWREEYLALHKTIREKLSSREFNVISLKFGFSSGQSMTLPAIGMFFNVSDERIRQILAKATRRLKNSWLRPSLRNGRSLIEGEYSFPTRKHVSDVPAKELVNLEIPKECLPQDIRDSVDQEYRAAQARKVESERRRLEWEREQEEYARQLEKNRLEDLGQINRKYAQQEFARAEAVNREIRRLNKLLSFSPTGVSREAANISVTAHGYCPQDVVKLFVQSIPDIDKSHREGFYLVFDPFFSCFYAIGIYGFKRNPYSHTLRLEVWSHALIPSHIKDIIFSPGYPRRVELPPRGAVLRAE